MNNKYTKLIIAFVIFLGIGLLSNYINTTEKKDIDVENKKLQEIEARVEILEKKLESVTQK